MTDSIPTMYEWAGGAEALERLTEEFYRRVRNDELLAPIFAYMGADHPKHVAVWLGEVFRGPETYTKEQGGFAHMLSMHRGRAIQPEQRDRWVQLMLAAADEVGLPADPEFRSAFIAYVEWGSRRAMANSQPDAKPSSRETVPRWGWGEASPGTA
ncbi:group II truncated hemoglobin [Streptomyces sp. H27-D2]|uniref:group II truncated hemoglobin n=1 Tax=Streptomyces sp. H27-D2 TaxID=3046304 RepID=UPI002DB9DC89|nr:group II truncated hemoglobin [Streptomyces sp. H27-D2]MEC4020206.1 group II truncated hemoglobin [Streptomyces sp. H27-D2]